MAFGSLRNCGQLSTGGSLWPLYSIDFAETTNCRFSKKNNVKLTQPQTSVVFLLVFFVVIFYGFYHRW